MSEMIWRRCPHCTKQATGNHAGSTCGNSYCQEAEYHANKVRNGKGRKTKKETKR